MRIQAIQHVPFETPAALYGWADCRGHTLRCTHLYRGESLAPANDFDLLLILGGPMGVADTEIHPWLLEEKRCIQKALDAGKKLIGICLGAQLLAEALGARVWTQPHREIGWFPIHRTDPVPAWAQVLPATAQVFHWHGQTFNLPAGAEHLARSAGCENQIFAHGDRVLGLQCHLELDQPAIERLIAHCGDELDGQGPCPQTPQAMLRAETAMVQAHRICFELFDQFLATPSHHP